jgi:hypothetical protein
MNPDSTEAPVDVRYYERDGSVFLDSHYLIKGVAGAIFWKLACESHDRRRHDFSLRELRLAGPELRLPDVQDNLSTRLLQRRLAEHQSALQIHKAGRGRFRVELLRPLQLTRVPDPARAWPASMGIPSPHAPHHHHQQRLGTRHL